MAGRERQLKAIVFSDVVDSSVKIFADELIAIQRIKEDLTLIREELQRHGGLLVKSLGDGLLATFDGPTQALEFIQAAVQKLSVRGRQSLAHRFGLHTGEIYADGDDILGQGVHLASRLQTVSPANGVAFVRSTYDLIDPRFRRLALALGEIELKGLPEPMQVFSLEAEQLLHDGQADAAGAVQLDALLADTPFELVRPLGRSTAQQTLLLQERQRARQGLIDQPRDQRQRDVVDRLIAEILKRVDRGQKLHSIIGGVSFAAVQGFLLAITTQQYAPSAWSRITLTSAVGKNFYFFQILNLSELVV